MKKIITGFFSLFIAMGLMTSSVNAQQKITIATEDGKQETVVLLDEGSEAAYFKELESKTPQFLGGADAMMEFIKNNISYPNEAVKQKVEGTALVEFLVNGDGSISDIKLLRDPGAGLGEAAINLIKKMPNWQPVIGDDGEAKPTYYTLPISYKL